MLKIWKITGRETQEQRALIKIMFLRVITRKGSGKQMTLFKGSMSYLTTSKQKNKTLKTRFEPSVVHLKKILLLKI